MKKTFTTKNITPFDLARLSLDQVYEAVSSEYLKQFNRYIEIVDMKLSFVKDGIKVNILEIA